MRVYVARLLYSCFFDHGNGGNIQSSTHEITEYIMNVTSVLSILNLASVVVFCIFIFCKIFTYLLIHFTILLFTLFKIISI